MGDWPVLVFDVDGTLADTERDGHRVAFNRAFSDAGLDWQWSVELYGELLAVTGGKERIRHYLEHHNTAFERPQNLAEFIADLHRAKTGHYMALMAQGGIPLRPGVARLLDEARDAGWRLAIATTTTPENVSALVESTLPAGAMQWFEVIGAGDVVPQKKPAPDIYRWVMDRLEVAPGQVIAFEDSENGLRSALSAGIRHVVITTNDYTVAHDFTGAGVVLDSLGEPGSPAVCQTGRTPPSGVVDLTYLAALSRNSD